ncbi:hypothetical protein D9M72_144190 [compost metagenome]
MPVWVRPLHTHEGHRLPIGQLHTDERGEDALLADRDLGAVGTYQGAAGWDHLAPPIHRVVDVLRDGRAEFARLVRIEAARERCRDDEASAQRALRELAVEAGAQGRHGTCFAEKLLVRRDGQFRRFRRPVGSAGTGHGGLLQRPHLRGIGQISKPGRHLGLPELGLAHALLEDRGREDIVFFVLLRIGCCSFGRGGKILRRHHWRAACVRLHCQCALALRFSTRLGRLITNRGLERLPVVAAAGPLAQLLRPILLGLGIGLLFADRLEVVAEPAHQQGGDHAQRHDDVARQLSLDGALLRIRHIGDTGGRCAIAHQNSPRMRRRPRSTLTSSLPERRAMASASRCTTRKSPRRMKFTTT